MSDKIYICGICGKKYHTIVERNKCEMKCIEASEKAAAEKKRKELESMKELNTKAIQQHLDEAVRLTEEHIKKFNEVPTLKWEMNYKTQTPNSTSKNGDHYKLSIGEINDIFDFLFH